MEVAGQDHRRQRRGGGQKEITPTNFAHASRMLARARPEGPGHGPTDELLTESDRHASVRWTDARQLDWTEANGNWTRSEQVSTSALPSWLLPCAASVRPARRLRRAWQWS